MPSEEEMKDKFRQYMTLPVRSREYALRMAGIFGELMDDVLEALKTRQWEPHLPADVAGCKKFLLEELERGADLEYRTRVQQEALRIMENHPGLKAEQVLNMVDSTILEMAVAAEG